MQVHRHRRIRDVPQVMVIVTESPRGSVAELTPFVSAIGIVATIGAGADRIAGPLTSLQPATAVNASRAARRNGTSACQVLSVNRRYASFVTLQIMPAAS